MDFFTDDLSDGVLLLRVASVAEAKPEKRWVPAYYFHICLPDGTVIGSCDLRVGHNEKSRIGGNLGYAIDAPYRGHGYAARALRLLFPLARRHGLTYLVVTCAKDNLASKRTCENAGGVFTGIKAVPPDNELFADGLSEVLTYRFDL